MKAKGLMDKASQMPAWHPMGLRFDSLLQESLQVFQWSKKTFPMIEITGNFTASCELVTCKKKGKF